MEDYSTNEMAKQIILQYINCSLIRNNNNSLSGIFDNCTFNATKYTPSYSQTFLYDVPSEVIVLLSFFYGTISVIAVVGNFLVIWIVTTSTRMQNVTNYYIANLALSDIVIGLFAIPFQFQAALLQRWNLPHFMCPFCPFVQVLSVTVSIFTLTAIALDRHRAILDPLRVYPSRSRAKVCITCIWIVAFLIALPNAIALRVHYVPDHSDPTSIRLKPFCSNTQLPSEWLLGYRIVILLVQYVVPLCIISCVYARMALRLWGSQTPGNAQFIRDANLMKNKKKVIKMLVIVVALFAFCWLPLQAYYVLQDIFPEINKYRYINIIFFCCDWLAMSNSCYNPFIYGIYNEKFKREFQQRFPFKSPRWRNSTAESIDTDRTVVAGRSSIRSSTIAFECCGRKNDRNSNDNYLYSNNENGKIRRYNNRNMYVLKSRNGCKVVHCPSESEFEELCL